MSLLYYRVKWIKLYGEEYHLSNFVLLGKQVNDLPLWGSIQEILTIDPGNYPMLYVEMYETIGINNHLMCFAITRKHAYEVILMSNLVDKYPYTAHNYVGDGHLYIAMRSDVFL